MNVPDVSRSDRGQPQQIWGRMLLDFLGRYTIQLLLLMALIVLSIAGPNFRQVSNIRNILLQSSFVGIGAAGMTLLMISGAFDLSVAGMVGLCGVVMAMLMPHLGIAGAILVTLLLGLVLGLLNGIVVTKAKIPAFIATLGMMNVFLSIGMIITNAKVLPLTDKTLRSLATDAFLGLPIPFVVMVLVYVLCFVILQHTPYGRYVRAVGSNELSGFVAGIAVNRIRIITFMLVGLFTAVTSVFLSAYLSSAQAIMATGYELRVIAVVVVGGTSLKGGRGTLLGSLTGALFFTMISNALNLFGVGAYWQYVAVGVILIVALALDSLRSRVFGIVA